jgi:hypothetical protein
MSMHGLNGSGESRVSKEVRPTTLLGGVESKEPGRCGEPDEATW